MRCLAIAFLLFLPLSADATVFCEIPEFVQSLVEMLRNGEFEKLEGQLTHLGLLNEKDPDGKRKLTKALDELSKAAAREIPLKSKLGEWSREIPRSHYPYTIRGRLWQRDAMRLRGDGRQPLEYEGLRLGAMLIFGKAREELERAHQLRPRATEPLVFLLAVRVADDSPVEVRQKVFGAILERDPRSLVAHAMMLEANMARWGGSHQAMFRFARETVAKRPDAPEFNQLIVWAHAEMARIWGDSSHYYSAPEIWSEVHRAYEAMAIGEEQSLWAYNRLASLAFRVDRPASARRAFERVGDAWDACAWKSSYDQFERARIWALRNAADEIDPTPPAELAL